MSGELMMAALGYAKEGWRVLPVAGVRDDRSCTCAAGVRCTNVGKHPVIKDWVTKATTDAGRIEGAWSNEPLLNVGLVCGEAFWVLDIDTKDDGPASLVELEREFGVLPKTLTATTGSGGKHYLFKPVEAMGNRAKIRRGIDARAIGGQIVAAPSRHHSGGAYKWDGAFNPEKIVDAPAWLIELVRPQTVVDGKVEGRGNEFWRDLVSRGVTEGNRNDSIARLAGHLLRAKVDPYLALDLCQIWNKVRISPQLAAGEVETTVDSIAKKERDRIMKRREKNA